MVRLRVFEQKLFMPLTVFEKIVKHMFYFGKNQYRCIQNQYGFQYQDILILFIPVIKYVSQNYYPSLRKNKQIQFLFFVQEKIINQDPFSNQVPIDVLQHLNKQVQKLMSIIFNNTFTADKPIYYPSNWQSGKTSQEQYNEFKQTLQFWILRNLAEVALSTLWVFILFILAAGAKQVLRLRRLNDNDLEKMHNRKYLEAEFLSGVGALAGIILVMSAILLAQDWGFFVLLKGILSFTFIYFARDYLRKGYAFIYKLMNRIQSKINKKQNRLVEENSKSNVQ